ncbi:hypothetical protein [Castellaniella sp.]|uniref:hypothetical protein n=1 Tax=Castellaniella sp. TaxID=1955812 RepID=UPI002AFE4B9C|nr:hypothetical protein [Castellaniella sp.]
MKNANRLPTADELELASQVLQSLGATSQISLINLSQLDEDDFPVLLTQDFSQVDEASILLVPDGIHEINYDDVLNVSHIIGLNLDPAQYPVLKILADPADVVNFDSGESIPLKRANTTIVHANVRLESDENLVLEAYVPDGKQFSDAFFNVQLGHRVDVLNITSNVFYHGRDWALTAFGSCYRGRNTLEKTLDTGHQGVFNTIDNIFRPLSKLGASLDKLLSR